MKIISAVVLVLALAVPASAQDEPSYSVRLFGFGAAQKFAATQTFNATLGKDSGTFWGGGLELVLRNGIFVDAEISTFKKTGQRADDLGGQIFELGIPETISITPIDVMAGYRLRLGESRFTPYAEAGATSYHYKESSPFLNASEDLNLSKTGIIFAAGVEVRLLRMLSVSGDVSGARVTGILGSGGVSQQAGENNLGGLAGRVRIIFGR